MDGDVVAAVSLGPDLSKDKFMQAVGRLRKLGRNQSIIIMATHEVFSSLPKFPKQIAEVDKKLKDTAKETLVQLILSWTLSNTIHENENLLLQYSNSTCTPKSGSFRTSSCFRPSWAKNTKGNWKPKWSRKSPKLSTARSPKTKFSTQPPNICRTC